MSRKRVLMLICILLSALLWSVNTSAMAKPGIKKQGFGKTAKQESVELYTLTNVNGMEARIMTYGGTVVSLKVPDRTGKLGDVVLGYDSLDGYLKNNPYFGSIIGRYGNRIGKAKFSLNGKEYTLPKNNGENTLHGGARSFHTVVWKATESKASDEVALSLSYLSK